MSNPEELAAKILRDLCALPLEQQGPAILAVIASALDAMSREQVVATRAEVAATFDAGQPLVAQALDLIEGHLALRDLLAP